MGIVWEDAKRHTLHRSCDAPTSGRTADAVHPIAVVTDCTELVVALRQQIAELDVSMETVDAVAGLPLRYTSKLLCRSQMKSIGRTSLGPLLGALGLRIALIPDHEALDRVRTRLTHRKHGGVGLELGSAALVADRESAAIIAIRP